MIGYHHNPPQPRAGRTGYFSAGSHDATSSHVEIKNVLRCLLLSLALALLTGCRDQSPPQPSDRTIPYMAIGQFDTEWPPEQVRPLGGTVTVWMNGNPVQAVEITSGILINPFCRPGKNEVAIHGDAAEPYAVGVYEQQTDGRMILRHRQSLAPRTSSQPADRFDVELSFDTRLPLFDYDTLTNKDIDTIQSEVGSALEELQKIFQARQWNAAAARVIEGAQIYRKARGWKNGLLQKHHDRLVEEYGALIEPTELCPDDQLRFLIGRQIVLVYAMDEDGLNEVIHIPTGESRWNITIAQLQFARVNGKWIVWNVTH